MASRPILKYFAKMAPALLALGWLQISFAAPPPRQSKATPKQNDTDPANRSAASKSTESDGGPTEADGRRACHAAADG